MEEKISRLLVDEEAMRCLLCYDAPCSKVCPAQTDPAKFIRSIRFKNYLGGIKTIRENNALGAVCSELCRGEKYCEKACIRNKMDRPINIKYLHEFLMDMEEPAEKKEDNNTCKDRVCVFGEDIKGLSAAYEFMRNGYDVILFSEKSINDYLATELNNGSLSAEFLEKDIKNIINKGLVVEKGIPTLEKLKEYDFKAILFAVDDIKDIYGLKEKSYYLNELVKGPSDAAFNVRQGREAAKKVIKEIE